MFIPIMITCVYIVAAWYLKFVFAVAFCIQSCNNAQSFKGDENEATAYATSVPVLYCLVTANHCSVVQSCTI